MLVKVIRPFNDSLNNAEPKKVGDKLECSPDRAAFLIKTGFVEEFKEDKPVEKKTKNVDE